MSVETLTKKLHPDHRRFSAVTRELTTLNSYCGNAKQSYYYQSAWDIELIAYAGLETGVRPHSSYVLRQGKITLVLTTSFDPTARSHSMCKHGDGVNICHYGWTMPGKSFEETVKRGAKPAMEPTVFKDEHGEVGHISHPYLWRYHPQIRGTEETTTELSCRGFAEKHSNMEIKAYRSDVFGPLRR